ncbi:MAG: zinc-ribbon domain-containing protein [Rhodobacteraceae bacterium]|nr:zinc-ribbon domain-containing protein [Paracoccaceae bacterium]
MRLICPNCDAQYEVDASAIPEAGRDVQCSNCGHAWFQKRDAEPEDPSAALYREPDAAEVPPLPEALAQGDAFDADTDAGGADPEPPPAIGAAPVQRTLDDSVLAVLREEAERETAARRAEAQGIELQGDLGLPPPVPTGVGAAPAAIGASNAEKRIAAMKGEHVAAPRPAARRDLLPDIEEINSTLRPSETRVADQGSTMEVSSGQASGFRSGFVLMLLVALFAVVLYLMAPQISAQIPAAAKAMTAYVSAVDAARAALDALMQKATGAMNGLSGG